MTLSQHQTVKQLAPIRSLLFVCTGNSCRSQMAEAILRQRAPSIRVQSAGVRAAAGVSVLAVRVLEMSGYSCNGQYAKQLNDDLLSGADLVVCLCDYAAQFLKQKDEGPVIELRPFTDPYLGEGTDGERLAIYESVRLEIDQWIQSDLMPRIEASANGTFISQG